MLLEKVFTCPTAEWLHLWTSRWVHDNSSTSQCSISVMRVFYEISWYTGFHFKSTWLYHTWVPWWTESIFDRIVEIWYSVLSTKWWSSSVCITLRRQVLLCMPNEGSKGVIGGSHRSGQHTNDRQSGGWLHGDTGLVESMTTGGPLNTLWCTLHISWSVCSEWLTKGTS